MVGKHLSRVCGEDLAAWCNESDPGGSFKVGSLWAQIRPATRKRNPVNGPGRNRECCQRCTGKTARQNHNPIIYLQQDRKSTRLNSSHSYATRLPSSACN